MKQGPIQKIIFWMLAACLATALALAAVFIAVNWNDREPSESARVLDHENRRLPPAKAEGNAYSYLLGLDSPQDREPRAVGAARLAWLQQQLATTRPATSYPDKLAPYALQRSPSFATLYAACRQIDGACATALEADPVQAVAWVSSEQWILDRYLTLLAQPAWDEARPFDPELPLAPYNLALDSQRLFFVHVWIAAGKGAVDEVRTLLGKDLAFWRRVLVASDNFTSRNAAVVAISRHFMWSSLVLRSLPLADEMRAVPQEWRVPFTRADYTIYRNVAAEYGTVRRNMALLKQRHRDRLWAPLAPLSDFVLHEQDAANRHAEVMLHVVTTLDVEPAALPAAVRKAAAIRVQAVDSQVDDKVDSWLYNVAGKQAAGPRVPELIAYVTRAADLEGLRRAALVTAQLRSEGVEGQDMPARLKAAEPRNPYTSAPFTWSETSQAVEFNGLTPAPRGNYLVFY